MPRVAVLMPARNAARTVRAAAASILRQTERDLSLVCVDDGSSDGTSGELERLSARDRRVRVLRGPGEGIAPALNRGLAACDAEVVARCVLMSRPCARPEPPARPQQAGNEMEQ